MAKHLAAERVRRDVEVLARAGLDLDSFVEESMDSLQRAVPFDAVCVGTIDPSTGLLTGTRKLGGLRGIDSHDHEWGLIEYGSTEPTAFAELAATGIAAAGVMAETVGPPEASRRMSDFMQPRFGFTDELRAVCRDERDQVWAAIALFRHATDLWFDADEVSYLGSLSRSFALGVRSGLLTSLARVQPVSLGGPVVLIVDVHGEVSQASVGAQERLTELLATPSAMSPSALIGSLVGAARRYARGEMAATPSARVRAAGWSWLVLHAAPLSGRAGVAGEVVVTIEEARPPEIVPLVVAAFGLTPRERDITQLVLQGMDTRDIATQLCLSVYTVQDHLKAVFDKAGVRSRRELLARVYVDQYVPRMDAALDPNGWFRQQP